MCEGCRVKMGYVTYGGRRVKSGEGWVKKQGET
jgi:hypothetical protein